MEKTMGDKRKNKEEKGPESKKVKLTEARDTESSAQEACSSSEATPSGVDIDVVCQEVRLLNRAPQQEEAARGRSCGISETVKETAEKENTKGNAVLNKQEEEDCKNDGALDQTCLKSDKSAVNELENEGKSTVKKDFLNALSEDVAETFEETRKANRLFKRPRSAGSPSSPVDNISEKASCSPNSEDTFKCSKKLKIDELDEENPELRSSPTDREDSESELTKEEEKTQCSRSQRNSLSDSAISPDSSEVKELNVVEFCRLTSFDQASVLNGNDISEQSSIKESACDEVFSEQPESCNKDNLNNAFPFERDVFPVVEQEAAEDFPRRRQRKKHIINAVQKLLEFYLSRGNLSKDKFLQEQMSPDGYVELTVFLSFNKVKCLTDELKLLKYAVKNSSVLELSNDEMRVKVKLGYHDKENELDCTVYVDYLPRTATRDWVSHYFTQFGDVDFVSLPLFKDSKRSRGFAFVEFRVPASAQVAIDSHENRHTAGNFGVGSHMSSSEISSEAQVCSSKCELLSAVPDSSSQGDDDNSGRVEDDIPTEETLTTSTTTTTATATTAGSEAESTIEASRNRLKNNVSNGNGGGNDELQNESDRASECRGDQVPNLAEGEQPLPLSKRICKNPRPKRCTGKTKLVGPGLTDELLELLVVPKRAWMEGRKAYLSEQKKRLGMCKAIMAAERAQEEALKIEFDEPRPQKQMPAKVPGVVVKVSLDKPIVDKASLIVGVKSMGGTGVEFVDCSVGEKTFHVRFSSRESANTFRHTTAWKSKSSIIEGQEEEEFWERVQSSWTERITKPRIRKKKRGKDKINHRWQKRREALEGTCSDVLPSSAADQE